MSANATARVTVKLLDQVSAPAQIVRNAFKGLMGDMKALSGARLGIAERLRSTRAEADRLKSSLAQLTLVSVGAALAFSRMTKNGREFESLMVDIRQKADMSAAATKALQARIQAIAPTVNQSALDVGKGVDFLLGAGMDVGTAEAVIPSIAKTATAYRAQVEDVAKAIFAISDNMKVAARDATKAIDVMAQAGKEGAFELKDMAREFPSLTASAEAIGIKGVAGVAKLSAALQIARKGAADGSEAATNTANLMQKIISPETTKKFAKVGIDIRKLLAKTMKEGGDPFVMIAEAVKKATKGDMSKLGDFFEDAQVQKFLRPLIANLDDYKRIRDKAEAATGVVEADFKLRMDTLQSRLDRVAHAFDALTTAVTEGLTPMLNRLLDIFTPALAAFTELVSANKELAGNLVLAAGAVLGIVMAAKAVRLAMAGFRIASLVASGRLLNYLAPAGAASKAAAEAVKAVPTPAAATTPRTGGSVPSVTSPGSTSTATTPRPMTAAEIATAAKGSAALTGPSMLTKALSGLKGGIAGAVVQIAGEAAIDKLFDVMPKPAYPAGYDPKAELNLSIIDRIKRLMADVDSAGAGSTRPMPLDPGVMERSRRAQDEQKRDPEGARGRAMMSGFGDKAASEGSTAGEDLGQGIASGLDGTRASIMAKVDSIIAEARSKLSAAGLSLPITPRLEGGGAALRGIHSDTGIN